jgi:phage-related protein
LCDSHETLKVLGVLIKIVISSVAAIVYLFSFTEEGINMFFDEVGHIFLLVGELFSNLAELLWRFFLTIPGVGDILAVFQTIIEGACDVLQTIFDAFSGGTFDIGHSSHPSFDSCCPHG